MIRILKIYAGLCFATCILFLAQQFREWLNGTSTCGSLLTFLGILFGAGAGFVWSYAKYMVDNDHDGVSDILGGQHEDRNKPGT